MRKAAHKPLETATIVDEAQLSLFSLCHKLPDFLETNGINQLIGPKYSAKALYENANSALDLLVKKDELSERDRERIAIGFYSVIEYFSSLVVWNIKTGNKQIVKHALKHVRKKKTIIDTLRSDKIVELVQIYQNACKANKRAGAPRLAGEIFTEYYDWIDENIKNGDKRFASLIIDGKNKREVIDEKDKLKKREVSLTRKIGRLANEGRITIGKNAGGQ